MTKWSGGFPPPNWPHHPQEGGGHASHSHENVESGHVHSGGTEGTYEHPVLGPRVDELPPLPDEVITGSLRFSINTARRSQVVKSESLDAMNTGHPEDRVNQTKIGIVPAPAVGLGSA
jgi:hypothetical protein